MVQLPKEANGDPNYLGPNTQRFLYEWDEEKNDTDGINMGDANMVSMVTLVVHWRCLEHGHEWVARLSDRIIYRTNCPVCDGLQLLAGFNDLGTVAGDGLIAQWHPTKNPGITPRDVLAKSDYRAYWKCVEHGHEWQQMVVKRFWSSGCPICLGTKLKAGENDIASIPAYVNAVSDWHPTKNGKKKPTNTPCGFKGKVWFQCNENDSHEWFSTLKNYQESVGCLICAAEKNHNLLMQEFFKATGFVFAPRELRLIGTKNPKSYGLQPGIHGFGSLSIEVDSYNEDLNLVIMFDDEFSHGANGGIERKSAYEGFVIDHDKTIDLLNSGYRVIRVRENALEGKLRLLNGKYLSEAITSQNNVDNSYFNMYYKSFDTANGIADVVAKIVKKKPDWFTLET